MSTPLVLLLPGNGYAPARLEPALAALELLGAPLRLRALAPPPGDDFAALLEALDAELRSEPPQLLVATGIGGLLALCQRAEGRWLEVPVVLQGAVLWGLEQRRFPRLMRLPGLASALAGLLRLGPVQRRFARRHFQVAHEAQFLERFFAGYRDRPGFVRWFRWLTPELLRRLERDFAARPEALARISCWVGGQDRVVAPRELDWTEAALGQPLPKREFPLWGHYPEIDRPAEWLQEVARALASPR
jgi:hypothetical protein